MKCQKIKKSLDFTNCYVKNISLNEKVYVKTYVICLWMVKDQGGNMGRRVKVNL